MVENRHKDFFGGIKLNISNSIILCTVGELAGRGSMAVAVGVSDMRQVTGDLSHLTFDT